MRCEELPLRKRFVPRVRAWWGRFHLPLLFLAGLATTGLGFAGFRAYEAAIGHPAPGIGADRLDVLYHSLRLFGLESGELQSPLPWQLQLARFLAPSITISALLTGLARIFESEIREIWVTLSRGHTVICGLGRRSSCLLRRELAARRKVVVIERNPANRYLPFCEEFGVHVIEGDAADQELLRRARLGHARRLLVCTGRDNENLEIAATAIGMLARDENRASHEVDMLVHLVDYKTRGLFRDHRVFSQAADCIKLRVFNVYENAARHLWQLHLEAIVHGSPDSDPVQLVVVGLGQMGSAVVCEALRNIDGREDHQLSLRVIDHQATHLATRLDLSCGESARGTVEWIDGNLDDTETLDLVAAMTTEPGCRTVVVLCMDGDYDNVAHALRLAQRIDDPSVPIFIRLAEAAGLAHILDAEHSDSALAKQIGTYGLLKDCLEAE